MARQRKIKPIVSEECKLSLNNILTKDDGTYAFIMTDHVKKKTISVPFTYEEIVESSDGLKMLKHFNIKRPKN